MTDMGLMPIAILLSLLQLLVVKVELKVTPYNCLELHNRCDQTDNNCQLDIIILKKMCGDYLGDQQDSVFAGCNRQSEQSCRGAIKTMNRKHGFLNCHCSSPGAAVGSTSWKQNRCRVIWRLLNNHPCLLSPPRYSVTLEPSPPPFSSPTHARRIYKALANGGLRLVLGSVGLFAEPTPPPTALPDNGCLAQESRCHSNLQCRQAHRSFMQNCQFRNCDKNGDVCVTSYQVLRHYGLFECSCMNTLRFQSANITRCLILQAGLRDNKCLAFLNNRVMYQTLIFSNLDSSDSAVSPAEAMPKDLKMLKYEAPNCLNPYQLCIQSPPCLQRYIEVEKHCLQSGRGGDGCPDYTRCLRAVRSFYSRPDRVTLNSVRCVCNLEDGVVSSTASSCHRQRAVLQPQCVRRDTATVADTGSHRGGLQEINCLQLMLQCLNDTACLDSFTVYSELCAPFHAASGPVSTRNCRSVHFFRCLDAYRTVWGSILTTQCNCAPGDTNRLAQRPYSWSYGRPLQVCDFFRLFVKPPSCTQLRPDKDRSLSKYENPPENSESSNIEDACAIVGKHKLPRDTQVRLESAAGCSLVCRCGRKCVSLACNLGPVGVDAVNDTRDFYQRQCHLLNAPSLNRCRCSTAGLSCKRPIAASGSSTSGRNADFRDSEYKLVVRFSVREFTMIRLLGLIEGVGSVIDNLNSLMVATNGFRNCRLSLHSAREVHLTFLLQVNVHRPPVSDSAAYFSYYVPSEEERIKHLITECVMSMKLLQIMIKRHYAEIMYTLPLSIILDADIIVPPQMDRPPQSTSLHSRAASHPRRPSPLLCSFLPLLLLILLTTLFAP